MKKKIRTVIADDDQQFLVQLTTCLRQLEEIDVVGTAVDGQGAIDVCLETLPDVVILALTLPLVDGTKATRAILDINAQTGILIMGEGTANDYALQAIKMGAKGYLQKQDSAEAICTAVCQVYDGDVYIPSELASLMLHEFDRLT